MTYGRGEGPDDWEARARVATDERRTGRSTRQILASPQRFFFVVGTWSMMNVARTLQRKHAPDKDMTIIVVDRLHTLNGVSDPVIVDHDVIDRNLIHARDLQWLQILMSHNNP